MTHPHLLSMTVHGVIHIDDRLNVTVEYRQDGIYLLARPTSTAIPAPAPEPVPTPTVKTNTKTSPAG